MSDAFIGHGTQFQRGDGGGPEVFTTIAEVTNISGPGLTRDIIDVTHMDTVDAYREFIAGLADAGEMSVDLNFLPANASQNNLLDDFDSRVIRNFKIIWSDAGNTVWTFSGIVTGYEITAPIDDKATAALTVKIIGKPVFGA